jgi:hypothetical protein
MIPAPKHLHHDIYQQNVRKLKTAKLKVENCKLHKQYTFVSLMRRKHRPAQNNQDALFKAITKSFSTRLAADCTGCSPCTCWSMLSSEAAAFRESASSTATNSTSDGIAWERATL